MGMEPDRPPMELIQEARERLSRRIPPVEIEPQEAPVNEIVLRGDGIDLTKDAFRVVGDDVREGGFTTAGRAVEDD